MTLSPIVTVASPEDDLFLIPAGFLRGPVAALQTVSTPEALPVAGNRRTLFTRVVVAARSPDGTGQRFLLTLAELDTLIARAAAPVRAVLEYRLDALSRPARPFAGLSAPPGRPLVMGILNVTPDSFSDGGHHNTTEAAIAHGLRLLDEGADIIDIGGESTRPGSAPVAAAEEIGRVVPVIRALSERGAVVSVDTRNAATMEASLAAGARIINDVTALTGDPRSGDVIRATRTPVILMHMQGEPGTMQDAPSYRDALLDVASWLQARVRTCVGLGLPLHDICVDPGLGFGKDLEHNMRLCAEAGAFPGLGTPVLMAGSRKRFIGALTGEDQPLNRLGGSIAMALKAAREGALMVRVHDVAQTLQALRVARALDDLTATEES
ncbi:dihydropteroate synthase [Phaeovibrio sulfidiphilus]|uniref:dihydropteroate synthase n=1 Tax=Phaeovibrio sulfidiphilus TaxID=1220600 RepID=A0A8J6YKD3_9PROT|nr:dihydropteroate synthase [Phaeovibrio sulfidiphilus]MBE1236115.1 dihydropteroate synthase [Phaeovibrio sulfidiphilus]